MASFETYLLVLGLLLAAGALLSGLAHRSILSLSFFFLAAGMMLGPGLFGVIDLETTADLVKRVTELTLIVILFVDGLEVERSFVRRGWHVPTRTLLIAMPLTAVFIALVGGPLLGLSWGEAFLLGALLSPTDPVLTSSVCTNPKIPARIRNSLNLESGFNDGLALPAVILFAHYLLRDSGDLSWWQFLARDVGVGAAVGFAGALVAVWLVKSLRGRMVMATHYLTLYAFAVSLSLYAAARFAGGNGFIAVYLAGIVMAAMGGDQAPAFPRFSRDLGEVLKLATFVIFGSLLAFSWWVDEGWRGLLFVLFVIFAARTLALLLSLIGTRLDWQERAFMAWFGPKGVACVAYSLLVLGLEVPGGVRVFHLTALVVVASIILHGASDTPLANRFARRQETPRRAASR